MHSHYVKAEVPNTLEELNTLFLCIQKNVEENAFYYWHYTQLAQISDKIRKIQNTVINDSYSIFTETFKILNRDNYLKNEEYPGQYIQTIKVIMLTCVYWKPYSKLVKSSELEENYLDCIWCIIYPVINR